MRSLLIRPALQCFLVLSPLSGTESWSLSVVESGRHVGSCIVLHLGNLEDSANVSRSV